MLWKCWYKSKNVGAFLLLVQPPHRGQWPSTTMYRSWGPLTQERLWLPSVDVRKKCAPGSIHDV